MGEKVLHSGHFVIENAGNIFVYACFCTMFSLVVSRKDFEAVSKCMNILVTY